MTLIQFPRAYRLDLPLGQEAEIYARDGMVDVMTWDQHRDSGWLLATFDDWPAAMTAALVHQAEMFACYGGGPRA